MIGHIIQRYGYDFLVSFTRKRHTFPLSRESVGYGLCTGNVLIPLNYSRNDMFPNIANRFPGKRERLFSCSVWSQVGFEGK